LYNSAVEDVVDEDGLRDELAGVFLEQHSTIASLHPRHQQLVVIIRQRLVVVQLNTHENITVNALQVTTKLTVRDCTATYIRPSNRYSK